jgi:hypothetical protein
MKSRFQTKIEKPKLEEVKEVVEKKEDEKEKKFQMPKKILNLFKRADKTVNSVVVLYLSQAYKMEFKLCKIVSGDLVVINNKGHQLNPKMIWRWGKYSAYIIKEIDSVPVSNEDYDDMVKRGTVTAAHVPLVKAAVGAIQKEQKKPISKNSIIAIVVIAVVGIILWTFFQ